MGHLGARQRGASLGLSRFGQEHGLFSGPRVRRGKNEPAEEEGIMLREKNSGGDELPQQQQDRRQIEEHSR